MEISDQEVRWFFQTHTRTELRLELLRESKSLKTVFRNHREKLMQEHIQFKIDVLRELYAQASVEPKWFSRVSDIPSSLSNPYADEREFVIIEQVDVLRLVSMLCCGNREAFLNKDSFRLFSQQKTDLVMRLIGSGSKLVPAVVSFDLEHNAMRLEDGRHRLRAAMIAEQHFVPVLVAKSDYAAVLRLLGC